MNDKELLKLAILTILERRVGKSNAITRPDLLWQLQMQGFNLDDRRMRDCISTLQSDEPKGAWIINLQNGDGYFYAANLDELQDALKSEFNRAVTIYHKVRNQARRASPILAGQFTLQEG